MAFNPVHFFRKYQRFWMAAVLLMCMITFVLCTGMGGDLGDFILRVFAKGYKGPFVAKIDGRTYHHQDMMDLRNGRQAANMYMRKFSERLLALIEKKIEKLDPNLDKTTRDKKLGAYTFVKNKLAERLQRPRFFDGGIKLEDLVDFKIWLLEADRMRIRLDRDAILRMFEIEFPRQLTGEYTYDTILEVLQEVRYSNVNAPAKTVWQGLANEYRVQMAKLALLTDQPMAFRADLQRSESIFWWRHNVAKYPFEDIEESIRKSPFPYETLRIPVSPAQLWDFYSKERREFNLALVPVLTEDFFKDVLTPSEDALQTFFKDYRTKPYDPTSDQPGFQEPAKVGVQWVTAQADSPHYKTYGQLMARMQLDWYALPHLPIAPGLWSAVPYALPPLAEQEFFQKRDYEIDKRKMGDIPFTTVPLTSENYEADLLAYLGQQSAPSVTSFLGALAQPAWGFAAPPALLNVAKQQAMEHYPGEFRRILRKEAEKRAPVYASMLGLGDPDPLNLALSWARLAKTPEYLAYKDEMPSFKVAGYMAKYERKFADAAVQRTMQELKKELTTDKVNGRASAIDRVLAEAGSKLTFDKEATKKLYDRYEIKLAPELKPLQKLYDKWYEQINMIEGRVGSEKAVLKESDFDKLFFDKGENFSAAGSMYTVRPWPPVVMNRSGRATEQGQVIDLQDPDLSRLPATSTKQVPVDLFIHAKDPVLFWIDKKQEPYTPERLDTAAELEKAQQEFQQKKLKVEEEFKGKEPQLKASLEALKNEYKLEARTELRNRVVKAWKIKKAREEFARPAAEKIAEILQKRTNDAAAHAEREAGNLNHKVINLPGIAPLVAKVRDEPTGRAMMFSTTYTLPKNELLLYPPDQMPHQLLMFGDPKAPLETGYKELDDLNKELFKKYKASLEDKTKTYRLVQIFTNKPRDRFFVAVATADPKADPREFYDAYKTMGPDFRPDRLIQEAYNGIAKQSYQAMMRQLRKIRGVEITDSDQERKSFSTGD